MKRTVRIKAASVVVMTLASGYVIDICFRGMNYPSDATYVGGIIGLILWAFLMIWLLKFVFKKPKKEEENKT